MTAPRRAAAAVVLTALLACAWAVPLASLPALPAVAREQRASLGGEVPAGKHYAVRLNGLSQGDSLTIDVEVSGPVVVLLLDSDGIRRWPNVEGAAFRAATEQKLHFSVRIARTGTHFVVLDNRDNDAVRSFNLQFHARSGSE